MVYAHPRLHIGSQRQKEQQSGGHSDTHSPESGTHGVLCLLEGVERQQAEKALWLNGKVSKHLPRDPGLDWPRVRCFGGAVSPVPTSGSSGRVETGPWVPKHGLPSVVFLVSGELGHTASGALSSFKFPSLSQEINE